VFLGGTSYSLFQALLLYDVLFSHNTLYHRQTDGSMMPIAILYEQYDQLKTKEVGLIQGAGTVIVIYLALHWLYIA